jgi:hypothetical protein
MPSRLYAGIKLLYTQYALREASCNYFHARSPLAAASIACSFFHCALTALLLSLSLALLSFCSSKSLNASISSGCGATVFAPVTSKNSVRMSSSDLCFMSIVTTSVADASSGTDVVSALVPVCVSDGDVCFGGAVEVEARKIESVDGPVWSVLRFTVIGTAGLWYFNRGSIWRQNCLHNCSTSVWQSSTTKGD